MKVKVKVKVASSHLYSGNMAMVEPTSGRLCIQCPPGAVIRQLGR